MIRRTKCYARKCKHYQGVSQPDGTEKTERTVCKAFPKGIPAEIAYGDNLHTKPFKGDNGIQFEKKEEEDKSHDELLEKHGSHDQQSHAGGRGGGYSEMSGEEVLKEVQGLVKKREGEKKQEKKERSKQNSEFKDLKKTRDSLPTVGSKEEKDAAKKNFSKVFDEHEWGSGEMVAALVEKKRLDAPVDKEGYDKADKAVISAGKKIAKFEGKVRARNKEANAEVKKRLELPEEERIAIEWKSWSNPEMANNTVVKKGVEELEKLVSKDATEYSNVGFYEIYKGERSYYRDGVVFLEKGASKGKSTVVHELGHHLERMNPKMGKAVRAYRRKVTEGAEIESLHTVKKSYGESEKYKKRTDGKKWINPYMGKVYQDGGTELLSMGMELLTTKPQQLASKDPELFSLCVNAARGKIK